MVNRQKSREMINQEDRDNIREGDIIEWLAYDRITFGTVSRNEEGELIVIRNNGKAIPLSHLLDCPSANIVRR